MFEPIGWHGTNRQVLHFLRVVGADRDAEGKFLIEGGITTFLGLSGEDADVVVHPDAVFFREGRPRNLALGLGGTSYGRACYVI